MSVTPHTQRVNCTPATRAKSNRLDITMMTRTYALVQGDTDLHQVWLDTLECSCQAGQHGLRCSHAMCVLRELARRDGKQFCAFGHSRTHAQSFAALQVAKGRTAEVREFAGYMVVMYGTKQDRAPVAAAARPVRSFADVQRDADALFS